MSRLTQDLTGDIAASLKGLCPKCNQGRMFAHHLTLDTVEECKVCAFPLAKNDSGDGPAVFMIFILGFLMVPLAIWLEVAISPPLWVHVVLWGLVGLLMCGFMMQPLKAYVIRLQYRHLPEYWDKQ